MAVKHATGTRTAAIGKHGSPKLPSVIVDSYNVEAKDDEGFVGDRASRRAFREILENWRKPLRKLGADPFGDASSEEISRRRLDSILASGDLDAAAVVQSAMEEFAHRNSRLSHGASCGSRRGMGLNASSSAAASAKAGSGNSLSPAPISS